MSTELQQLEATITALEAQRPVLGDAVVAMAIAPLHEKLAVLRARAQGEQQLKTVTILFMDVVGSTRLSEHLDPEDVHAVMDTALERLSSLVRARNGRVLKYAGDSLLAVFGAEEALEDDAERAVRAGLGILEEAPRLAAEVQAAYGLPGFNLRVGINTGRVLLGGGVDGESSIRGTPVNIAARMEQTAPPGGLRISHQTYRHVRGVFDVEAQAPMEIKGITGPVRSYLVLRVKPRAFRVANRGLEGVDSAMVGRDEELARIAEAFQSVRKKSSLALVTVVGEPGIGKSRLGFEFTHWLELLSEPVRFFQGRPHPYGNNVPFGLLRDLIAWRFEILESDSQAAAQAKLARGFGQVLGERAAEFTALVGQLIGFDYAADPHIAAIASEGKQIRDRAFHALAEYFRLLHQQDGAPIVLLLDDLHWADDGSLDFVGHLVRTRRDLPILILGLTRPALYERRPDWGSSQSNHQRIPLAPLTKRGTRELVETLLGRLETVPAALRDLLASSAEGNPYFVEELIGMLIDEGVIVTTEEPWRIVGDKLLEVNVPTTLVGVLQARIDGLPAPEKAALQQASVIGHVFWDEALRRIAPTGGEALGSLMLREVIYAHETSAFEGAREFVFKHHMLHQVTYQSVLRQPRREQHRLTADWLVERSGDRASEYYGLIAHHYDKAGDAANAVVYLHKAGADAKRRYVNQAALDYLGRALALMAPGDMATRFEVLRTRYGVFSNAGQRTEQEAEISALEQLAEQLDDDARRASAASLRSAHALVTSDYAGAVAAAARAVRWAESAGAPGAALFAQINWARALQFKGDYSSALDEHIERALTLAREVGDKRIECVSLTQLGILAFQRGRFGEARGYYQQALALSRAIGDRGMESGIINNLGDTERLLGNYAGAFELCQAGRRVCSEIGQRMADAYILCNMAHIAFLRGDPAESLRWSKQASEVAETLKDPDLRATLLGTRGHAHTELGEWADAEACYREATAIYREIGRTTMTPEPVAGLARLALARGDVAAAMSIIAEVIAHFDGGGSVDGTEDPLWIYITCHQVLTAAAAPRAAEFLERAHRLLSERAQPLGAAERATFLGNVPSHRTIVAAWERRERTPAMDARDSSPGK